MPRLKHTREVVDAHGNRITTENEFFVKAKTMPFISIPLPVSAALHTLTSAKDFRVLLALAELAEFNTNAVFLVARRRQEIMALAAVSSAQLSTCLKRLRASQVVSGPKGEAVIHPSIMWKGDSATKKERLAQLADTTPSTFDN
ncbi:MAG: hypothetical protein NVS3B25_19070 [Hymenobacter sp.]